MTQNILLDDISNFGYYSCFGELTPPPPPLKLYSLFALTAPSRLGSSFPHIPKALKWKCGIHKNVTLTNTNNNFFIWCLSISYLLLVKTYKLNFLLTLPFYKIQFHFQFPVALSNGITFLAHASSYAFLLHADVGENRLLDQPNKGLSKCYQPQPSARLITLTSAFIYLFIYLFTQL